MSSWHQPVKPTYVSQIIYDSGSGTTTADNRVVFNDYDTMISYINNKLQGAKIQITLVQNETLPSRTNQNWNGITWNGNGKPASLGGLKLTIPDGFTISSWANARLDGGLYLQSVSTSPVMTISSGTFLFSLMFANIVGCTQKEFFKLDTNSDYFVLGVNGGSIVQDDGYEFINLNSNFPILVSSISGPNASIDAETIRGTTGFFFNQYADPASKKTSLTNTQSNFSGTNSPANITEAENLDWDAKTINTDTTTGLKIGGSTTQKLGFYNSTPITQPANTVAINDVLVNLGLRASGGSSNFSTNIDVSTKDIVTDTTTGTKIGTATTQKLGFFGATPIVQPAEITDELTTITHTAPGTPDYAIAAPTNASAYGFTTADEFNTVMSVIANLQTRNKALEDALHNLGLLADAD